MYTEQQHVETNLKATFAGISVFLSFKDEKKTSLFDNGEQIRAAPFVPYIGAECRDIHLVVQVMILTGYLPSPPIFALTYLLFF